VEIIGMMNLTEKIYKAGLADRPLSASQIHRLLGGSDARRYGQVNRALKAGELIKPRRGLYVLNPVYRKLPLHPFVLAQQMLPGSYVSAESALGFHGWISESVHTVLSMTHGGKSVIHEHAQLGKFEFRLMTTRTGYFLQSVVRHGLSEQAALFALWRADFFEVAGFQGGTSLRILHGLNRFSEDMDFILRDSNPRFQWQPYLKNITQTCEAFGVAPEVLDKQRMDSNVRSALMKDTSIANQLNLRFYNKQRGKKLTIKLEIDVDPSTGSGFGYTCLIPSG